MHKANYLIPVLLVLALAACGGGGGSAKLSSSDVATVGSTHITQQQFDTLMVQAKRNYTSSGRAFPKQGTSAYLTLKSQAIAYLVQRAERDQKAASLGIKVTDKQIQSRLTQLKKQYFGGSEKKYEAQLKSQGVTDQQVRDDIRAQIVDDDLSAKVTKGVKVSDAAIHSYYTQHISQYTKAQSRDVRHILVKSAPLAQSLYQQLKAGNDKTWCTLAKKYSQDPASKNVCGKLTVQKGQTVAEFDAVAFSQPIKVVHAPVHNARYGWFVIEPLSAVHPRSTTPESKVKATISQTLATTQKTTVMNKWVSDLTKSYCTGSKVKYQAGFAPNPDPCSTLTSKTTTT